jgi:hypothetical protein
MENVKQAAADYVENKYCAYPQSEFDAFIAGANWMSKNSNYLPIMRPLSDLYKKINHNGKEIEPICELLHLIYPQANVKLQGKSARFGYYNFFFDKKIQRFRMTNDERGWQRMNDDKSIFKRFLINIHFMRNILECHVPEKKTLFDYMDELKIDYRGLIDAGLAIDCYKLKNNPYK